MQASIYVHGNNTLIVPSHTPHSVRSGAQSGPHIVTGGSKKGAGKVA
jgi:hypothetical protein